MNESERIEALQDLVASMSKLGLWQADYTRKLILENCELIKLIKQAEKHHPCKKSEIGCLLREAIEKYGKEKEND